MTKLTEDELLIINSIIYTDDYNDDTVKPGSSIYDWACRFNLSSIQNGHLPAEINQDEFQNIINTIESNKDVYSKMIIKDIDNSKKASEDGSSRVVNVTIQYEDSLIVAYKGTGGPIEWRDNGVGAYSNITDTQQQKYALDYYKKIRKSYGGSVNDIYVTGHSKGGNKAQYVGALMGSDEKLKHVYSFDGHGFNRAFLKKYKSQIEKSKGKITNLR